MTADAPPPEQPKHRRVDDLTDHELLVRLVRTVDRMDRTLRAILDRPR